MKEQVIIHQDQCIGCGLCAMDCPSRVIAMKGEKAVLESQQCVKCGHCIAICPKNAVEISDLDMCEVKPCPESTSMLDREQLMDFYKSMRTIRRFKGKEVESHVIEDIIDSGRYTSTATNRQGVRYIVVRNGIQELEDMVLPKLKLYQKILGIAGKVVKTKLDLSRYRFERGFVFRGAPVLIMAVSEHTVDAALAARSMEIMSRAHGLGGLHVGLFTEIANKNRKIKETLGLSRREKVVACLALGYPDVKYQRTVPRRKAKVEWR